MGRPGRAYRTKTLFIEGVVNDLFNKMEVKMRQTVDLLGDEPEAYIRECLWQDRENIKGAIDLLFDLGFITELERDTNIEKINSIETKYFNMTKTA